MRTYDEMIEDLHWLREEADFCTRMICQKVTLQKQLDEELDELQYRLETMLLEIANTENRLSKVLNDKN